MTRRIQRVPYKLDPKGIAKLDLKELAVVLRATDPLVMKGGRNLLVKVLKGSKQKKLLALKLNENPAYGRFRHLRPEEILARIDRAIMDGYLVLEYDYRLPLLAYSDAGWEIEKQTLSNEYLNVLMKMADGLSETKDMSFLKDHDREMILLLLDKIEATGDRRFVPLLREWQKIDYRKVRLAIGKTIKALDATCSESVPRPCSTDFFLTTQRLGFRTWSESDLDLAIGLWGDPKVTKLIDARKTICPRDVSEMLSRELAFQQRHRVQYWPVFLLATGEHVGACGLRPKDMTKGIYELGFHIRPGFWNRGYATETARAVIEYAFERLNASALFSGHHPDNGVSRHILLKLGFKQVSEDLYLPTGRVHPSYELSCKDFIRLGPQSP